MEKLHIWISIPFCSMYLAALLGNGVVLFVIRTECSLHQPVYLFLSMPAIADLMLPTVTLPKMLALFWFCAGEISFVTCLTQMFFLHFSFSAESVTLLVFDWVVAICYPLCYAAVLTQSAVVKARLVALLRSGGGMCRHRWHSMYAKVLFPGLAVYVLKWEHDTWTASQKDMKRVQNCPGKPLPPATKRHSSSEALALTFPAAPNLIFLRKQRV